MIEIKTTLRFEQSHKKFIKNDSVRVKSVALALKYFIRNPKHPGLNLEKMKNSKYWTIRVDKGNRIFFIWVDEHATLLLDIGPHDKYRKY